VTSGGSGPRVVVFGAGAFGAWSALMLKRGGARVTLVDAWGPGHPRASSHGETRVIRATYGSDRVMTALAARALALWKENEPGLGSRLYKRTGALWMTGADDAFVGEALPLLRDAALPFEELTPREAARRWPQIDFSGVRRVVLETEAGYLRATDACVAVVRAFVALGGEYRTAVAEAPGSAEALPGRGIRLRDGTAIAADRYVFACGPWLGRLFPALLGGRLVATRQEIFVFGPPAGDPRFSEESLPVWLEIGERFTYGVPAGEGRGFKVGDDTRGPEFDPTDGDRTPSRAGAEVARACLVRRFPALAEAPLLEATVCQYENSPDRRFIVDRHPDAPHLLIVGGGSGHGFKMGPAIGEIVAAMVLDDRPGPVGFDLARFRI
jgi:glycine/D-amino acid oxidase-like deaminating enzyme